MCDALTGLSSPEAPFGGGIAVPAADSEPVRRVGRRNMGCAGLSGPDVASAENDTSFMGNHTTEREKNEREREILLVRRWPTNSR